MTVRLRESVVSEIRRLTRRLAAEADRDITQSDALDAAIRYAYDHLPEVAGRIPQTPEATDDQ